VISDSPWRADGPNQKPVLFFSIEMRKGLRNPAPRGAAYPQHNSATVQPTAVSGKESGISTSPEAWLPAQEEPGLTLDQYATAKKLLIDFLKTWSLSDITCGAELALRYRIALDGDRFRWKSTEISRKSATRCISPARSDFRSL
jgi:hypothetical protein